MGQDAKAHPAYGWQQIAAGLQGWRRALERGQIWEEVPQIGSRAGRCLLGALGPVYIQHDMYNDVEHIENK